jgi:uncharacterized protein DUF5906
MSGRDETEEELNERLLKIRAEGSDPIIRSLKAKSKSARGIPASPAMTSVATARKTAASEPFSVVEEVSNPLSPDQALKQWEQRMELGLGNFPFEGAVTFQRLDAQGKPIKYTARDIAMIVSSWYVKKDTKFYDINRLGVPLSQSDVQQSITHRVKEDFPANKLDQRTLKDLYTTVFDPANKYDPEVTIPVWSGRTISRPGNKQRRIFVDGLVEVNTWQTPAYRENQSDYLVPTLGAFGDFLSFILPKDEEREMLLNWMAWNLRNEPRKGKWAIFLYSEKHGTGKSTLADVCKALFGEANTARSNGVSKLVARFNKEVLEKKLVIVEEVEVKKGSYQANAIKSLITEDSTTVEAKGQPSETINHHCCFLMTSNHLPLWLEGADRRFYILNLDHQGYNNGGTDYEKFKGLVAAVYDQIASKPALNGLYQTLLSRDLTGFDALSLSVNDHATDIMKELANLSPDVVHELVADFLKTNDIKFVPQDDARKIVTHFAHREANAQTHLFSELGWKKKRFAWGGQSQRWAWYHPDYKPEQGQIRAILHHDDDLGNIHNHLAATLYPAMKLLLGLDTQSSDRDQQ